MINEELKIKMAESNIRRAIEDYGRYVDDSESKAILENISDTFITRLARDNYASKSELRELFRKSPAWNEELDAIVINGTRTHECDYDVVLELINDMVRNWLVFRGLSFEERSKIRDAFLIFNIEGADKNEALGDVAVKKLTAVAPHAYHKGKKITRIFRAFCQEIGLNNATCPDFDMLATKICDELTSKKIDFKLFVSLNPAHFLTMSNPKHDSRGQTLTSCHSLNCTEYRYNNGCTGYARDNCSIIAFTVKNPDDAESLNNRKTQRQMFFYRPYQGILLQSRLYNDNGGTRYEENVSKLFRDLIQREISDIEGRINHWSTNKYCGNKHKIKFYANPGFGGYHDWEYEDFNAKISMRYNAVIPPRSLFTPFYIGADGLCLTCGKETNDGLYCSRACSNMGRSCCDECGNMCHEGDLYHAYDSNGEEVQICEDCYEERYAHCSHCGNIHHYDNLTQVGDYYYCPDCLEEICVQCEDCSEWIYREDAINVGGDFYPRYVCEDCLNRNYSYCECCEEYYPFDDVIEVNINAQYPQYICRDCADNLGAVQCSECGEYFIRELATQNADGTWICQNCQESKGESESV